MTETVVLDSSVIVSSLLEGDIFRPAAREIMKKVFEGDLIPTESSIIPPEVIGAISRRAGPAKAKRAENQLRKWEDLGLLSYAELDRRRSIEATQLALTLRTRGMDSIIIQIAKEKDATLITFDDEMASKAKNVIKTLTAKDYKTQT
ncbi:MAG: PIN domain-containing protein [Thaumarchaeota archaeon]|nr:PIN domain-containing protein [Nitrososphaerota archaeon]